MSIPEYLNFFHRGGEYRVQVRFKNSSAQIAELSMAADEIGKLIDPATGDYYAKMYFDDHLCDIYKYEIDRAKKLLTIRACFSTEHKCHVT